MTTLPQEITNIANAFADSCSVASARYLQRVNEGSYLRAENPASHFCAYFLPYNPKTKEVFIIHHKKANLWLSPGGHIEPEETLLMTLNREIQEELGVEHAFAELPKPFLISLTPIDNQTQPCKEHLDIWFAFKTDGKNFSVDQEEFHASKWIKATDAHTIVTDPANLLAIKKIAESFS